MRPRTTPHDNAANIARYYDRARGSLAGVDDLADFEGTPWLTGLANFCAVVGTLVGTYALIGLIGYAHRGPAAYWPMALLLVLDVAINAALQLVRFRRRRAEGLTRAERRRRVLERRAELRRARVR
jgi:hypothetical protein